MNREKSPKRLFLIDGYSNIFRAYYAIRELTNSRGEPTNAVYGFTHMLRKLLRDENPDFLGVALDTAGPTVRDELFQEYKANRAPFPEDLLEQMPRIRRVLEGYRIPILELESYEADDVLGTLAWKAAEQGYEVVLISADKDLMQLVRSGVSLYHTGRDKLYDPALVKEDFGVPPEQVVDVLALMGDSVDNVPGVPGIGKKGARQLIEEYGSVEALLDRAGEVKRKSYREGLQEHRDLALLSKELVTIHTNLDVPLDPHALQLESPDEETLREVFGELEFFSLLEELGAEEPLEPAAEAQEIVDLSVLHSVERPEAVVLMGDEDFRALGFVTEGHEPRFVDLRKPEGEAAAREAVRRWLDSQDLELRGHDMKQLLRWCAPLPPPRARLFDLMLVSYVLRPSMKSHGLGELAMDRLRVQTPTLDALQPGPAAGAILDIVGRLASRLGEELTGGLEKVYREIEEPLIHVLMEMEEAGVLLDKELMGSMSQSLATDLAHLEESIFQEAGEVFNIQSPRQLGVILFEKLGYPVLKKTRKTKSYSTGAETLEELAGRGYALPGLVLKFRELAKLKSTYVDPLPGLVAEDGRLHTRYQQAVAATGRLSSVNPNLQNIPVRTESGKKIRAAFVAPPGRVLLVADYNQIELRLLAHIAQEEAMIEAFRSGQDIHQSTAARVFGIAPDLVSPDQRRAAKVINFGIIYGMSGFGLARALGIEPREAQTFIDGYFSRYPGVKRYTDNTVEEAEKEGRVETLFGRVRWLPELKAKNRNVRENARRMAVNARIQGTAADILKLAMIGVHRRLRESFQDSRLLLTVHDEVVLETPEQDAAEVADAVREEMSGVVELTVPLKVDTGWGSDWYHAKA